MAQTQITASSPINNVANQESVILNNVNIYHVDAPASNLNPMATGQTGSFGFITSPILGSGWQIKDYNLSPSRGMPKIATSYKNTQDFLVNSIDGVRSPFVFTNEWLIYQNGVGIVSRSAVPATGQTFNSDYAQNGFGNLAVAVYGLPMSATSGFYRN